MKAILQIIGPRGVGKTTLCTMLLHWIGEQGKRGITTLALDASPGEQLTQQMTLSKSANNICLLAKRFTEKPTQPNEAIDWAFNDMVVSIDQEIDLLPLGPLGKQYPTGIEKMLDYGLSRLIEAYDFVVVDGEHPILERHLPAEVVKPLIIITPERWDKSLLLKENDYAQTPAVIVNQCGEQALSSRLLGDLGETLDTALDAGQIRLIGKLPFYTSEAALEKDLPQVFYNCLLRLDLPFSTSPSL